jgi:NADH:flavin oxidoreductases, Old Yellow Enzyme family
VYDSPTYPTLRTPVDIGSLTLPHRVVMGSMHLNLERRSSAALAAFYTERVRGGAALIVTGGAAVSRVGAGNAGYTLIAEPEHAERWRPVVDAVHREGGLIALQLFHAGRYAFPDAFGLTPVAPSAVYSRFSRAEPEPLTDQGIHDTIADFAAATLAAVYLGFDAVEVMASEGYLINQFASPVTNLRDDAWGGDAERRRAFPAAVTRAVRDAAGDRPVLVRMSGDDLVPGSQTPAEVDALAVALVHAGADAIAVGIGWHESRVPTVQSMVPHAAWVGVSARISRALADAGASVPVIASNRINSLAQAERVLAAGDADLVSMARPFLADPHIVAVSFAGGPEFVNPCIACNEACIDRSFGLEPVSCTVNPRAGRELEFASDPVDPVSKSGHAGGRLDYPADGAAHLISMRSDAGRAGGGGARGGRSVAVVGAGPAGMEAARAAASAGARVTLFEAGNRIGGQFLMAGAVPGKEDFLGTVAYFEHALDRLGVDVRLGRRAAVDGLAVFDEVVLASGVLPRRVSVAGVDAPHVIDYARAFADLTRVGRRVAVVGAGGIAVDLAHLLSDDRASAMPREVTIMRRSGPIGAGMGVTTRWAAVQAIRRAGVRTLTEVRYLGIEPGGVRIRHDGAEHLIEADTVIIAAGQEPNGGLAGELATSGIRHTVIGGARDAVGLNAVAAFEQGLRAGDAAARGASRLPPITRRDQTERPPGCVPST